MIQGTTRIKQVPGTLQISTDRSQWEIQRLALRVYSVPGKAARTKVQTQLYRFRRFETGFGSVIVDHQVLSKYAKKTNRFWIDY